MTYFLIFISKLLENTLATLRIILIANNKKMLGAILTFAISLIWIFSVSFIVVDFKDYLKIFYFALGSGIGSYLGNIIEEKIALGCIIISFKVTSKDYNYFKKVFLRFDKNIIKVMNNYKFEINVKRKLQNKIIKLIKKRNNKINVNVIKIFNC